MDGDRQVEGLLRKRKAELALGLGIRSGRAELIQAALRFDPDFAHAWYNLGVAGGGTVGGRWLTEIEC